MGLLGYLFGGAPPQSAVLINIGAESVGGAYAVYAQGALPDVIYTKRIPLATHEGEAPLVAMNRALLALGDALVREGAPALLRATGSGSAGSVLVAVDAPWQKTHLSLERIEKPQPFVFSESLVVDAVKQSRLAPDKMLLVDERVIATVLDGYQVGKPYGRRVHRATIVTLTSFIDEAVAGAIDTGLSRMYHGRAAKHISGTSLRYQALSLAFPHDRYVLMFDVSGGEITLILVRHDLLEAITELEDAGREDASRIASLAKTLRGIAAQYPLPRTIFVLGAPVEGEAMKRIFAAPELAGLWLSENPPTVVAVAANHLTGLVANSSASSDVPLLLMALYSNHSDAR